VAKKNKKKAAISAATKFGGAFKQVLMAAATHPATACLAVMTMTVVAKATVTQFKNDKEWKILFNADMTGLYNGAQSLGVVCAAAPIVTGALGVVKSGIEAYAARPVTAELGYP